MSDRLSDDSVGMAALEHSGESTIPYESDVDRAPARTLPLRGRRGASVSGDGSDLLKHKFTKGVRTKEYGTPRGREVSQVKALEGRLRRAEQERLAATCEAAASMSNVLQQAEVKVATVEASALEQVTSMQALATCAEKEASVREQVMMRQMQEQMKAQACAAECTVSELRNRVTGETSNAIRREVTMANEVRNVHDGALSREAALRAELAHVRSEAAFASQRENKLASEVKSVHDGALGREAALRAELVHVQSETASASQRENKLASDLHNVMLELQKVQLASARDRESDRSEAMRIIEQVRSESSSSMAKVVAEAESMQHVHAQERARWETTMKEMMSKAESNANVNQVGPSLRVLPPPGFGANTGGKGRFVSADGILSHCTVHNNPPDEPGDPSGGAAAWGIADGGCANAAVSMLCSGAPPPPPPPHSNSGSGAGCGHHGDHGQGSNSSGVGFGHRNAHGHGVPHRDGGGGSNPWPFDGDAGGEGDGVHVGIGTQFRRVEASTISITAIPAPSQFRSWRISTLREIAAASLFPAQCYAWVLRAESDDDLTDATPFCSIDGKMISALNKILNGELLRQVQTIIESDGRAGRFTSGRSMLRCILRHFATSAEHGQLYDLSDLLQIRLSGSTPQALESFATSWGWVEQGMRQEVSDDLKGSLLWEQLKDFSGLQPELLPYRISSPGDTVHTYAYLRQVMHKHVERTRQERTRAQIVAGLASLGGGQNRAYAANETAENGTNDEKALPSRVCYQWQRGECRKGGKCRFTHPPEEKGIKPRNTGNGSTHRRNSPSGASRRNSPAPGGSTSRGGSPANSSASELGNRCLSYLKTGKCRFGDRCRYTHERASSEQVYKGAQQSCIHQPLNEQCQSSVQHVSSGSCRDTAHTTCNHTQRDAMVCVRERSQRMGGIDQDVHSCAGVVDYSVQRKWIVDSGAGVDLIGKEHTSKDESENATRCNRPVRLSTANGRTSVEERVCCEVQNLNVVVNPYLLDSCPPVLSLGKRVIYEGFDFIWKASDPNCPRLVAPNGEITTLTVERCVPMLVEQCAENVAVASACDPIIADGLPAGTSAGSEDEPKSLVEGGDVCDDDDGQQFDFDSESGDIHDEIDMDPPNITKSEFLKAGKREQAATSRLHMLTHYPKNRFCPCCRKTKAISTPARRIRPGQEKVSVKSFGEMLHIDHLIAGESCKGREGEKVALIIIDQFTGFGYAYPSTSKSAEEVISGIRHFLGDGTDWRKVAVKSDNSLEIKCAVKELGLAHYVSTPYRHQANGLVERFIRRLVESTRASLAQACLPLEFWTHGIRHAAMCYNLFVPIVESGETPWIRRMGSECEWDAVHAFGSRISAMIHGGVDKGSKFDPTASECVILSWFCAPGFVWKDNEVITVLQGVSVDNGCEVHVHRTREVTGEATYVFPFVSRAFGQGRDTVHDVAEQSSYPFRQVTVDDADDRTLKIVGEGLDTLEHQGALTKSMVEKGWRLDRFGDRLVKTPPNSTRPPFLTPEDWRSIPLAARRAIGLPSKKKNEEEERSKERSEHEEYESSAGRGSASAMAATVARQHRSTGGANDERETCNTREKSRHVWFAGETSVDRGGMSIVLDEDTMHTCEELCRNDEQWMVFVEVCCEKDSVFGRRCWNKIVHVRVTEEQDVRSSCCQRMIKALCERLGERVFIWCSPPCTTGCSWHRTRPGLVESDSYQGKVKEHRRIAECCLEMVKVAQKHQSSFAWEWPKSNDLWKSSVGVAIGQSDGACERLVDGCAVEMYGSNQLMKKPWRIISNHGDLLTALNGLRCLGKHEHEQCRGAKAVRSGKYTEMMADIVMSSVRWRKCDRYSSLSKSCESHGPLVNGFDPKPCESERVNERRRCWACTANAIRNAVNIGKQIVSDYYDQERSDCIDE
eukprot:522097-Amphidinium_carterae.1